MSSAGSVTQWLNQLQAGDPAAVDRLWERYFRRILGLARQKLPASLRRAGSEEDVALDAFASFCRAAEQGRFPELVSRTNLWRLLVVITVRKAYRLIREEKTQPTADASELALAQIVARDPTPEFEAQAAEECARLVRLLGDARLETIARWRLEGYTVKEIAQRLQCSPRTIERKVLLIQAIWAEEEIEHERSQHGEHRDSRAVAPPVSGSGV
jgi:RNA polymerase sigma factor (sigma-70 family)